MKLFKNILLEIDETDFELDGKINWNSLIIEVENKAGTYREGKSKDGKKWKSYMFFHYGRIKNTTDNTNEMWDIFINPDLDNRDKIFRIKQNKPSGEFDEYKYIISSKNTTPEMAKSIYLIHYDRNDLFDSVKEISVNTFIKLVKKNIKNS